MSVSAALKINPTLSCSLAPSKTSPPVAAVFKARLGHTEGAAGLHGALAAIACGLDGHVPSNPQTRTLNPYVASALSGWRALGRAGAIPRVWQSLLLGCTLRVGRLA